MRLRLESHMVREPPKKRKLPKSFERARNRLVAKSRSPSGSDTSLLVVDTNAWIDHLDAVLSFGKHYTLIVPSAVVQELDGLKQDQDQLGNPAGAAIKAIYNATMTKALWIQGQRHDENVGGSFWPENKDDEILSCAIYFNTTVSHTVLVTADSGLALKANINCIPTADGRRKGS